MLLKHYKVHAGFGEWLLELIACGGALPRRFLSMHKGTAMPASLTPSVVEPLQQLTAKSGVRVLDLILDLRSLPSTAVSTARLALFSFISATVCALRVAGSLLRFRPTLWDYAALTVMVLMVSRELFRLLHVRSAVTLLARTVTLTPKQLSLLDLAQHSGLYAAEAAKIAATGGPKPSDTVNVVAPATAAAAPVVPEPLTLRRRAASVGRSSPASTLRVRKGADTLPATGLTSTITGVVSPAGAPGALSPLAALGSSFASQLRQSTANGAFAAGGGDATDTGRLDSLGLQYPSSAATNALSAAIEAAAAVRQAELASQQQQMQQQGGAGAGAGAAGGANNALWNSGFGQMKGLITRLWKADGDTLLVGGSADRTAVIPAGGAGGGGEGGAGGSSGASIDEDTLLGASTVAPVDRSREPYLGSISSPSAFMRRAGDALPIIHVSALRRPLSFDAAAGGPLQALDATAAAIQRVLHRHFTRVLLEAIRRNTINLMEANKLLTPAFLTRGGGNGGGEDASASGAGAAASGGGGNVVRLPGIRSNQPMTLDELLVEMTTRAQPDSRYLPRRSLSNTALSVDTKPFASTSKPPVPSEAAASGAGSAGGFAFGIPGGVSAQMFSQFTTAGAAGGAGAGAGGATASIAERLAADARRAKAATDSVVVDLWQERVDLESFLCPPISVLASAGVISPAVAAELNAATCGPASASSGPGSSGANALAVLAQVKAYCFARLAALLGERNGLGRFLGNTDPITSNGNGGGSMFSGRPSDSLLLLNYLFALMDLEMIRAARFTLRQQQMQAAKDKETNGNAGAAPAGGAAAAPASNASPASALLQSVAGMRLSDRPFSRSHLAYGPIPTPPAPNSAPVGPAGALSPRQPTSRANNAASADPRSPLALPELSSAVSGTSTVVAAQRARIKLHFDLSPTSASEQSCLIGLTLPALQTLLERSSVASLLATGSLRAVGGPEAVSQGLGAGPVLDPAAILAAVTVTDIGNAEPSRGGGSGGAGGGMSAASRTVLPRTLALFFLLLRHTYSSDQAAPVGSPHKAGHGIPPLKYCEVPLQWAVRELLHAFFSSSSLE